MNTRAFRPVVVLCFLIAAGAHIDSASAQTAPPLSPDQVPMPVPSMMETAMAPRYPGANGVGLVRIKDVTTIAGDRSHALDGIGLVNGLKGTGSKSLLTARIFQNLLKTNEIRVDSPNILNTTNMSVVTVSGEVPPNTSPGEKFWVNVSVSDDATSLRNGTLFNTELRAYDGEVYAIARGPIIMGGYSAEGESAGVQVNHDTVGKVQAQLEVPICESNVLEGNSFRLLLRNKDYATALQIVRQVNTLFPRTARVINAGVVEVGFPHDYLRQKMDFVVLVNSLKFEPDQRAKVVINQKTGTVVVGSRVKINKVMFANSNLVITTNETPVVSQPAPFSEGETTVVPRTQISATQINSRYNMLDGSTTVGDLANALNSLGVSPQDLISVFQSLAEQGYLQAELVIQ